MNLKFPKMTRLTTGLGPNPVVGGKGGMQGGSGGAPISFTATLADLVAGQSQNLDTGTLQSGFRTPYFIDEIRMQVVTDEFLVGLGQDWSGIGGDLRVKFQTGNRQFSKNPVPMELYGPVFSQQDSGTVASGVDGGNARLSRSYANVRWPLPKPLWMAPGDVIQAVFEYLPVGGPSPTPVAKPNVTINITYVGRTISPGTPAPSTRQIPWVSFFEYETDDSYLSTTDEFRNPFTYPMVVQRFTERMYHERGALDLVDGDLQEELTRGQTPAQLNTNGQFVSMRLYDSLGYAIVKEFAPIGMVFDTSRHAWTFSRSLGAREQFDLTLRTDDVNGVAAVPVAGWYTQVGMVGYRDEVRD